MSTYLWVILGIIAVPFGLSFEKRVCFCRKWPALFVSILMVSPIFLLWDAVATSRGDWGFSAPHILGIRLGGLPLEEILFFVVVPYSCLFTYEVLLFFFRDRSFRLPVFYPASLGMLAFVAALFLKARPYSYIVLMFGALTVLCVLALRPQLFRSRLFWGWMLLCHGFFFVINYILTAVPVVTYNEDAFSGVRVLTIPVEDFLYNFCMLTLYLLVYLIAAGFRTVDEP